MNFSPYQPRPYQYVPIQYDAQKNCIDPRAPVYRALRQEWIRQQRVTPRYMELETQAKAMTAKMLVEANANA
jgi:hypothetical protein